MSRKGIPLLLMVSLLCLFVWACAEEGSVRPKDGAARTADDPEKLEAELEKASETRELIAIRDELAARAIGRGVTPDQIRETAGDADAANALLGLTPGEAQERFERIGALVGALHGRYPALAEMAAREEPDCPVCDAEGLALAWEHYSKTLPAVLEGSGALDGRGAIDRSGPFAAPMRPPLKCKMTQLTIGFGLCSVKSGGSMLFYSICAYGVFCSSCDGGIADIICP